MDRVIIHCDMNNYFASVECLENPLLKDVPFIVSGDPSLRHGIVLSKNEIAKRYNIITGESSYTAKQKCPDLIIVKPDYPKYLKYAKLSREIYQSYSRNIYPYGLDEAWIDVTEHCKTVREAREIAKEIKNRIREDLKLDISVGISFNFVFAKLASDLKLKDKIASIYRENFQETAWKLPVNTLMFVGSKTDMILKSLNIITIGDLARADLYKLKKIFGKKGQMIQEFACGNDSSYNFSTNDEEDIKSLGNAITPPKDITSFTDAKCFLYILSSMISRRLLKHRFKIRCIVLVIRKNDFNVMIKQRTIANYTDDFKTIFMNACQILNDNYDFSLPLRSIGIRVNKITTIDIEQLSFFNDDNQEYDQEIKKIITKLTKKYGEIRFENSATKKDNEITINNIESQGG
ncbi:MAG: DNA polymerase IV [Bacilli bacterium]|nr:DNA polymerase IV [Bacilli bacterium]